MPDLQSACPYCARLDASMYNLRCGGCKARVKKAMAARGPLEKPDVPYLPALAGKARDRESGSGI